MTFCASASFEGAVFTMFTLHRQALKSTCDKLAAANVQTEEEKVLVRSLQACRRSRCLRWSVRDRAV